MEVECSAVSHYGKHHGCVYCNQPQEVHKLYLKAFTSVKTRVKLGKAYSVRLFIALPEVSSWFTTEDMVDRFFMIIIVIYVILAILHCA